LGGGRWAGPSFFRWNFSEPGKVALAKSKTIICGRQSGSLGLEQAALQQRLHISPPLGDHKNGDTLGHDSVNDAVGLEENLAILPQANGIQFLGVGASLGVF
jgi:hypothetical protein